MHSTGDDMRTWRWEMTIYQANIRLAIRDQTAILATVGGAIFLVLSPVGAETVLGYSLRDVAGLLAFLVWVRAVVQAVATRYNANGLMKLWDKDDIKHAADGD